MKRDISKLKSKEFDVVIIGGGIFGACAAWDASLRGLSVALIEREDFCSGSSANSFKFIHGGIRYLQHGDIIRLRASCRERSALLRIAPHLVHPMPILIPTYGFGKSGKFFLGAGMLLYDILTLGRNWGIRDASRWIKWTRFFSKRSVLKEYPDLDQNGLTGGAMFGDAQMYNPTRLVLSFVKSAVLKGAIVANYLEALTLIQDGTNVVGVEVHDKNSGETFFITARTVLNTAGPWSDWLLRNSLDDDFRNTYSRDACFVVKRRFASKLAIAVQGRTSDPDALLSRPARHLFLVPWRDFTLIGVWHRLWPDHPDTVRVDKNEIQSFIDEINWAYPELKLSIRDVLMWNAGLVPFGENEDDAENLSYGKRSLFTDHKRTHNLENFVTLVGIRYTTARGDSAKAIDLICKKLGKSLPRSNTESIPLVGGDIADFERLVSKFHNQQSLGISMECIREMTHNHGTEAYRLLEMMERDPELAKPIGESNVLKVEIQNSIDNEMITNLSDVVFRRTHIATGGNPGTDLLRECARFMATRLGWEKNEVERQLQTVLKRFPDWDERLNY